MRATASATASSAMSSAAASCCISSTPPAPTPAPTIAPSARELAAYGEGLDQKPEIVALSKIDAVDEETLAKQTERLKRAIRSHGPAVEAGAKRARPLLLSTATRNGVTEVLRAAMAEIEAGRAESAQELAAPEPWSPV